MKVLEAEWNGKPTYLIFDENKKMALKGIWDRETIWTNRIELAWHNPSKEYVESIIKEIENENQRS